MTKAVVIIVQHGTIAEIPSIHMSGIKPYDRHTKLGSHRPTQFILETGLCMNQCQTFY